MVFQMTKRQLFGLTVTVVMFLAFVFANWLAPIFGYSFPQTWTIGGCIVFALAWGIYRQTDFARKN
jgi:small neutral amino acid transporter SnatA (MarC family)